MAAKRVALALAVLPAVACYMARANARCPGSITLSGFDDVQVIPTGWENISVANGEVRAHINGRAYFADACDAGTFHREQYLALNLLGKAMSYTIDLNQAGCGCNAALYLVSMPQNKEVGDCDDYYCDANSVCGVSCSEIDIMEANTHAWHSTLHTAEDSGGLGKGFGGGGKFWNGPRDWDESDYGPGGRCIDTLMPFNVRVSFPTDNSGKLTSLEVRLSQVGSPCPLKLSVGGYKGNEQLTQALAAGMTPVLSFWSNDHMYWLDGEGKDHKGPCPKDSAKACPHHVTLMDFGVELLGSDEAPRQPPVTEAPSTWTVTTTTEAPSTWTVTTTTEAPSTSTVTTTTEAPSTWTVTTTTEAPSTSTLTTTTEAPSTSTLTTTAPSTSTLTTTARPTESPVTKAPATETVTTTAEAAPWAIGGLPPRPTPRAWAPPSPKVADEATGQQGGAPSRDDALRLSKTLFNTSSIFKVDEECHSYVAEMGCTWTEEHSCPGQAPGWKGQARDDGSLGYRCCCQYQMWKENVQGGSPAPSESATPPKDALRLCVGSFGADVGSRVCCGQDGYVNDWAKICPRTAPTCVGYIAEERWGTCQVSEPWQQCGGQQDGKEWWGPTTCTEGFICQRFSKDYAQCIKEEQAKTVIMKNSLFKVFGILVADGRVSSLRSLCAAAVVVVALALVLTNLIRRASHLTTRRTSSGYSSLVDERRARVSELLRCEPEELEQAV